MSRQAEFEIVSEAPHVDRVLFDNVLSCYDWSKKITATYTLGDALISTTWDWIGVFRCTWRHLGDYVSYQWASQTLCDCTSPRRRSAAFPAEIQQIGPDKKDKYQLIYVSSGNRVKGISSPFIIWKEDDLESYNIVRILKEISFHSTTNPKYKLRKRKAEDTATSTSSITKDNVIILKTTNTPKEIQVYRDDKSLVDFLGNDFHRKLRIVDQPVVREYGAFTTTDINHVLSNFYKSFESTLQDGPSTSSELDSNANLLPYKKKSFQDCIGFRDYQSIKTGPQSFLLSLKATQGCCSNCLIAKDLIQEYIEKEDLHTKRVFDIRRGVVQDRKVPLQTEFSNFDDTLQAENCELKEMVRKLECKLAVRNTNNDSDWVVSQPKRIYRLNKLIVKQERLICDLEHSIEEKTKTITHFKEETLALRKELKSEDERNKHFQTTIEELNLKLKSLCSKGTRERKNEWSKLPKKVEDIETQTTTTSEQLTQASCSVPKGKRVVKNKQISKIMCAEKKQPKSKLHKERRQAEQCPTCGLKFSAKADARVIEEHIECHDRKEK